MNHTFKICFTLLFLFIIGNTIYGQEGILSKQSRPRLMNDEAKLFSPSQVADLEQMLIAYDDSTSTQIAVITVNSLNGYAAGDYAARLGEEWGVGGKGKDNGIVILIKPRIGNERGEVFIATGYGVEHVLTDARVGRIIDNYMIPYLPNDYYTATKTAILGMIQMLSGEYQADPRDEGIGVSSLLIAIILLALIFYAVSRNSNSGGGNDSPSNRNSGGGTTYFPTMGRGFGRSSGGARPSSGGFGGFGGGRFGGGGSRRSF